jgi:hypothetical protein
MYVLIHIGAVGFLIAAIPSDTCESFASASCIRVLYQLGNSLLPVRISIFNLVTLVSPAWKRKAEFLFFHWPEKQKGWRF